MPPSLIWVVTLSVGAFFTFVLIARIVRRSRKRRDVRIGSDFSIDQLHKLMSEGTLSPEEFERARQSVLSRARPTEISNATPKRGFEVQPVKDRSSDQVV